VLVDRCPQLLREADERGLYPIHLAVAATKNPRQLEVVRYLVQKHPASLHQRAKRKTWRRDNDNEDWYLPIQRAQRETWRSDDDNDNDDGYLPIHIHIAAAGCSIRHSPPVRIPFSDEEGNVQQQLEVIQFLVEKNPESLGTTARGEILPVHQALRCGVAPDIVQLLLRELPVSIPDETRLNLLHFAVRHAKEWDGRGSALHDNAVAVAVQFPESLWAKDPEGSLPIHVAVNLGSCARNAKHSELARRLANLDPDSLLQPNDDGDLPLHITIVQNGNRDDTALALLLLRLRPEAARVAMTNGNVAIHCAIEQRMFPLVRLMVRLVPETLEKAGAFGRTPLHVAVARPRLGERPRFGEVFQFGAPGHNDGLSAIVDLLIESCPGSLLVQDTNNDLPLHVAIVCSSDEPNRISAESDWTVELVTTLLDRSPDSIRTKGAGGKLPLHVAISKDPPSLPLVQLLVERCPESLDTKDADGMLPLHVAVSKDPPSLPLVQLLVERCPESLEKKDCEGSLPLVLAAEKAHLLAPQNETASLDLIYWLLRAKPESVASHRADGTPRRSNHQAARFFFSDPIACS
jgi:ankyrin repeat protein